MEVGNPEGVVRQRVTAIETAISPSKQTRSSPGEEGRRHSVSSADSRGSSGRHSHKSDPSRNSPIREELKRVHKVASAIAIAITESHDSDKSTASDVDDIDAISVSDGEESDHEEEDAREVQEKEEEVYERPKFSVSKKRLHWIDSIDRALCLPIYRADLGFLFETLMLIFGTWFGLPVPAWGLWTAAFAVADEYSLLKFENESHAQIAVVLVALAFLAYIVVFVRWVKSAQYQRVYGNLKQLASIPMLFVVGFYLGSMTGGRNAGAFFVVAWVFAEVIGHFGKYVLKRMRPVAYLEEKDLGHRYYNDVQAMFSKGHTAMESFPSADTIGGSVFSATLYKLGWLPFEVALPLSFAIAFSRLYLQAHHLTDVAAGLITGWTCTLFLWGYYGPQRLFGPGHAVFSCLFFVVFALVARKFKKPLPPHLLRKKSMLGF